MPLIGYSGESSLDIVILLKSSTGIRGWGVLRWLVLLGIPDSRGAIRDRLESPGVPANFCHGSPTNRFNVLPYRFGCVLPHYLWGVARDRLQHAYR